VLVKRIKPINQFNSISILVFLFWISYYFSYYYVIANYDLFRSEYLTDFNFNEYIQDLISEIISSYSTVSNTVKVNQILVTIS